MANSRDRYTRLQPPRNGLDRQAFQVRVLDDQGPPFKGIGLAALRSSKYLRLLGRVYAKKALSPQAMRL